MDELSPSVVLPTPGTARHAVAVAFGVSPGEALWLTAPAATANRSVFPPDTIVHLHSYRSGSKIITQKYRSPQRPHFVQRTKDGVLFVNARTRDDKPNAWVMDDAARTVRWLSLGDGLSDVRVSPAGKIWTAFFDEGVFGNGDGAAGLMVRDGVGGKVWAYDAQKAGTDDIADVYAFNLAAEDDAWVYFYTPFAIVRWRKNKPTVWQTRVEGARAIAVRPSEALLFGDYDDPTSLRILDLPRKGGKARVKRRLRLRLPRGTDTGSLHALGAAHRLILWSKQDLMMLERW